MLQRLWIFIDKMESMQFLALFVTFWVLMLLGFNLLIDRWNKKIDPMRKKIYKKRGRECDADQRIYTQKSERSSGHRKNVR